MMQRIITTLYALANLLDRSCHAPAPIRWLLVRLLCPIEPMIRAFVLRTGWEAGAIAFFLPDPVKLADGDSRSVAWQLANCFEAFAHALESLPRQLYERWRGCEAVQVAVDQILSRTCRARSTAFTLAPAPELPLIDTS